MKRHPIWKACCTRFRTWAKSQNIQLKKIEDQGYVITEQGLSFTKTERNFNEISSTKDLDHLALFVMVIYGVVVCNRCLQRKEVIAILQI